MPGVRITAVLCVAIVLAAAAVPVAVAPAQSAGDVAHARLQGKFILAGIVTDAYNVAGEHKGERVRRTWTFIPGCQTGPCGRNVLVRSRGGGATDRLTIYGRSRAYFTGSGNFYAPLRCAGGYWRRGSVVPFTITVRITGARTINGVDVASRITATYTNRSRINRTPCVGVLGHDAASYHGHLVSAPPA